MGFFTVSLLAMNLYAQQKDTVNIQQLDEVVVSDSRFELPRELSGKTVIRIGPEELIRNQGRTVAELVSSKSGLEISGSLGRQGEILGVFARGGRGRQVLVLVDGLRVSDPSSFSQEYDLRLLDLSNIESIEIIKGATSTLYGANAAAAVISITTKKETSESLSGHFISSIGTNQPAGDQNYNMANFVNNARIQGTLKGLSYALGFGNKYSNGMSSLDTPNTEADPFSWIQTDFRLGFHLTEKFVLAVYGNQVKMNSAYDESFGMVDAPYRFLSEQNRIGLSSGFEYAPGEIQFKMAYTDYQSENISNFPGTFTGYNYTFDLYNKFIIKDSFYTLMGLNYTQDNSRFAEIRKFSLTDPYVNLVYVSDFGLHVNTGTRFSLHSEYGGHLVYSLNPSFTFATEGGYIKALTSIATAFISPSLTQLFGEFGANKDLQPETNQSFELGVEVTGHDKLRASALYFNRSEDNFVYFDNTAFQYRNAMNTIKAQGVEVELQWLPIDGVMFNSNYTFTERKGDNAIRLPKHKLNSELGYSIAERTYASATFTLKGKRSDTDFNTLTDVVLEPYALLGCFVSHEVLEGKLRLFLDASNLFNTRYTEVLGFTTRGRNFRVGFQLDF